MLALLLPAVPAVAQPAAQPSTMRQPEQLTSKPSGFYTSARSSTHGAYRYKMMLVGLGTLVITAGLTYRFVRRQRPARSTS
jgi:hypothetical protein